MSHGVWCDILGSNELRQFTRVRQAQRMAEELEKDGRWGKKIREPLPEMKVFPAEVEWLKLRKSLERFFKIT